MIYRPTPQDVKTTLPSEFMGLCDGMMNGSEKEATVRVFCLTAQKHNRWELTQDELDERDSSGRFYWNGLISEGWFEEVVVDQTFNPTDKFFGGLLANGLIGQVKAEAESMLKLFRIMVFSLPKGTPGIMADGSRNYFLHGAVLYTLGEDEESIVSTLQENGRYLMHIKTERIQVDEVPGPYNHGFIIDRREFTK